MNFSQLNLSLSGLKQHYANSDFTPRQLVAHLRSLYAQEAQLPNANPIWLHYLSEDELEPYLQKLENSSKELPLYGVPFAIKDNIDLAGIATTAGCEAYRYTPSESARVVDNLIAAGALPMGKANLDQFATGLVGTRSPFGPCKNAYNPDYISGGSSSGSAVAVARAWVSFSLGTDTAGSGRVPASLNRLVGLKPSRGLLSTQGVVPACKSLDCVSIFTSSCDDAEQIFNLAHSFDIEDPYSRANTFANGEHYYQVNNQPLVLALPKAEQLEFFGDKESEQLFSQIQTLNIENITIKEIDFQPFLEAAALLYQGPWVCERYAAIEDIMEQKPEVLLDEIRSIIGGGENISAVQAFKAQYRLQALKQKAEALLQDVDALLMPTNATEFTIEQVQAQPIDLNSKMGYYTNFMNLFDMAAVAIPLGIKESRVGFGVTLCHKAFSDKKLLSIGAQLQNYFAKTEINVVNKKAADPFVEVVVCGAHLAGLPLNWQLQQRGGSFVQASTTSPHYQIFKLEGGPPFRPGLKRVLEAGLAIPVEVWRLPLSEFGSFVNEIPKPLGIGKVEMADGTWLSGFICEDYAFQSAENISHFGGWRGYLAEGK